MTRFAAIGLDCTACTVIRKRPLPKLPDQHAAIRAAFAQPVGVAPLRDWRTMLHDAVPTVTGR